MDSGGPASQARPNPPVLKQKRPPTDKRELDREIRRLRALLKNMEEEPQKCRLLKKVSFLDALEAALFRGP